MSRIAGLPNHRTERAFDLFMKVRYLLRNGGRLVGLTATPVSNTLAEVFTLQRYMQNDLLEQLGLEHFDAWAQMFADTVMAPEMTPDGAGFRLNVRLAKFTNIPELSAMVAQFCDIKTWEEVETVMAVRRPHLFGHRPSVVKLPASELLKQFTLELAGRAERIRNGGVDPREDNILKITSEGRKAALDLNLVMKDPPLNGQEKKTDVAAGVIARIYHETARYRATQLVFCDLGTPAMSGPHYGDDPEEKEAEPEDPQAESAFENIYIDLKEKLGRLGVAPEEIAFIHEARTDEQRAKMFLEVNTGKIRVLIGSTEKMGTGMNVQSRLLALHHLDAPWRPADIEQRTGRMMRQGNRYRETFAFVYITENSFDAYLWQVLETKARFIFQFMTGQVGAREVEDVSETVLSMAEIKALASGNRRIIERVWLQNEISKLANLYGAWLQNRADMRRRIQKDRMEAEAVAKTIAGLEAGLQVREAHAGDFKMTLLGQAYIERNAAGLAVQRAAEELRRRTLPNMTTEADLGGFRGFKLRLHYLAPVSGENKKPAPEMDLYLETEAGFRLLARVGETPAGTIMSLEAALRNLDETLRKNRETLTYLNDQVLALTHGLTENWAYGEKYASLKGRLLLVDKELLQAGVDLSGLKGEAVIEIEPADDSPAEVKEIDLAAEAEPIRLPAEAARPAGEREAADARIDANFDLEKIVARIREIHAGMPLDEVETGEPGRGGRARASRTGGNGRTPPAERHPLGPVAGRVRPVAQDQQSQEENQGRRRPAFPVLIFVRTLKKASSGRNRPRRRKAYTGRLLEPSLRFKRGGRNASPPFLGG